MLQLRILSSIFNISNFCSIFWIDPTPREGSKGCPDGFPIPMPGDGNRGEDICRNEDTHGFKEGWTCPAGCVGIKDPKGNFFVCKMIDSDFFQLCRFTSKQSYPFMITQHHIVLFSFY